MDYSVAGSGGLQYHSGMSELHVPIPFEAYTGEEPFLFVSYSHKDKTLVFPILSAWHAQGYRVWYDEGIDPGNEWPEEIANALNRCRAAVSCYSYRGCQVC